MFCWSCGHPLHERAAACSRCGAPAASASLRVCSTCGYRGEGMPYFRRASNAALLVGAAVFTYGIGGMIYWLVKRNATICPSCGGAWERSRALAPGRKPAGAALEGADRGPPERLPASGTGRRTMGVLLALLAVLLLALGLIEEDAVLAAVSLVSGLAGAASFGWGWKARQTRREALLRRLQSRVLQLARDRDGRLTATDVSSELELPLDAAERVLFSLDDGFRVRSEVTSEGLLLFEFPELRLAGGRRAQEGGGERDGT